MLINQLGLPAWPLKNVTIVQPETDILFLFVLLPNIEFEMLKSAAMSFIKSAPWEVLVDY